LPPRKALPMNEAVMLNAKLADMKDNHYRLLLAVTAITDLLIDKGVFTRDELEHKAASLEQELDGIISASLHPMA
jgi:hypothetical protein